MIIIQYDCAIMGKLKYLLMGITIFTHEPLNPSLFMLGVLISSGGLLSQHHSAFAAPSALPAPEPPRKGQYIGTCVPRPHL